MGEKMLYYYRIYDDQEQLNYLKSSLPHDEVEHWLKEYERTHQKYFNPEFIHYLHERVGYVLTQHEPPHKPV